MSLLHLDFARLKHVSIERVLQARGMGDRFRRRGNRLVGPCPIHAGKGSASFVADLDRNLWFCFSACGRGGDVIDLVRLLDRVGYREAATFLAGLGGACDSKAEGSVESMAGPTLPPPPFRPFLQRLSLSPDIPFLAGKGILPETARLFDAGAWAGPGFLEGCVGVRLFDLDGRPLGYAGRRLDPEMIRRFGKWKLPPRFPKGEILFNMHRVADALCRDTIVVLECPWGVMRLHQLGIPAVALLGLYPSETHLRHLRLAGKILLLLDGDLAGRTAAPRIAAAIGPAAEILHLPDGLDPDDLSDPDLRQVLLPFLLS
jgi:DNA primase